MKVCVNGSLITSVYEKEDCTKVKRVYVLAKTIELMAQKKENSETEKTVETQQEDLGSNADYPEDENTDLTEETIPDEISEDEIPF